MRQKNLWTLTHAISTAIDTATFHTNKVPIIPRSSSRAASNGKPASSVPAGQTYSQKVGVPNFVAAGNISTNAANKKYFTRNSRRGNLNFGDGILFSNSCNNPNGHKNPQTARPNISPTRITNPAA